MNEIIEMRETISLEKEIVHFSFVNFCRTNLMKRVILIHHMLIPNVCNCILRGWVPS